MFAVNITGQYNPAYLSAFDVTYNYSAASQEAYISVSPLLVSASNKPSAARTLIALATMGAASLAGQSSRLCVALGAATAALPYANAVTCTTSTYSFAFTVQIPSNHKVDTDDLFSVKERVHKFALVSDTKSPSKAPTTPTNTPSNAPSGAPSQLSG
jgi:hypothetical protein